MRGAISLGREQRTKLELVADVVIVGSGAAGAVTAAYLAEAGQDVVVLEEGGHHSPQQYGSYRPSEHIREMWRDSGMTMTLPIGDSPAIQVMMGRCIGGSSLLTGGVCFRTPGWVLDEWVRDHGLVELSTKSMEPVFEEVERICHIREVPLHMRSRSTQLFDVGASANGHPLKPTHRNTKGCNGCGRCNFGCPHGAKLSVDLTYLPRALKAGARIYSDCLVERVETKDGRAVGVVGAVLNGPHGRRGTKLRVRARRVVIAAGAWHSPILLKKSGVGRDSDQVGRNLTVHPAFRVMAQFDQPVEGWRGALQSAYTDAFDQQGFTLMSVFTPPGVVAGTLPGVGEAHRRNARIVPHIAMFGGMIHDAGGGTIRRGIGREPFVTYEMSRRDRHSANRLLKVIAEDFFAAGARRVMLPVLGEEPLTADQFRRLDLERISARRFECSSQHPLGTCRMGVRPGSSVVDPDGETWEVKDLFVVDGSVLPTSLGVNPQQSVMAMATRLAWRLAERKLPRA